MAEHFKFYPNAQDTVVPWNARYQFPSQSNKSTKVTPRISPKNGAIFNVPTAPYIRLEFPADGYVNPLNTTIAFDVTLSMWSTEGTGTVRFQNNIQSIFSRVRVSYGSTPLEDIMNYNLIMRSLTEWTATNPFATVDASSIAEGIGGVHSNGSGLVNTRQAWIQGLDAAPGGLGIVPSVASTGTPVTCTRRYQINLGTGLFTQDKLIPVKFMASQFAVEIELAAPTDCIFVADGTGSSGTPPTYTLTNVVLLPEIIHFDPAYDEMFLRGLREGGVPIKFSTWHTFTFATGSGTNVNLQIQERSRSVKALFALQRRTPTDYFHDAGATLASSAGVIQQFQWRIGGRYHPSAPVTCVVGGGSSAISNEGCEAWLELAKALNIVGDYRLSSAVNGIRWCKKYNDTPTDSDYCCVDHAPATDGTLSYTRLTSPAAGTIGSACFAAAAALEATNGIEISGLNAEEQSDISFMATYSENQQAGYSFTVLAYVDAMLVLRENNVMELIQ